MSGAAGIRPRAPSQALAALLHLRLPFSVILSPLFLCGLWLSGGGASWEQVPAAFLIIHLLLYGGMNAYNSYWDKDDGPIGALADPPPATAILRPFSLSLKGLAVMLGLAIGPGFGALVTLAAGLSLLYSHGRTRWKERPVLAAATIFAGQGLLGVLWGWAAGGGGWPAPADWPAILGAALLTLGFYPLTGVYQIGADAARGQQTLAVALGVDGCFRWAGLLSPIGGLGVAVTLALRGEVLGLAAAPLIMAGLALAVRSWRRRFPGQSPRENQADLMRIAYAGGAAFALLFLWLAVAAG